MLIPDNLEGDLTLLAAAVRYDEPGAYDTGAAVTRTSALAGAPGGEDRT
ncbi:hypothetical protein ABT061_28665 [Streptosporangium sp. NPDC002544]